MGTSNPNILIMILIGMMFTFVWNVTHAKSDIDIWNEFKNTLKKSEFPKEKIQPYQESLREPLLGFLRQMREKALWKEWEAIPEIHRVGNQIHFLIPLSFDNIKATYCFSFLVDKGEWYFQHLEGINIRLDKISPLPVSKFPDISESEKNWVREEIYWSFFINDFYLPIVEKDGQAYALEKIKDGAGYFLGAKAWVPFVAPRKAFILYLCWEQANLRGNKVTLEKFEDNEAILRLETIYFHLFFNTANMKPNISLEDYKKVFETIWQDRASNASWDLLIQYDEDYEVTFHFKKKS